MGQNASRRSLYASAIIASCGVAHFLWPQRFDSINVALGFTNRTRMHVYVNGGIETVLGLTLISPRTRKVTIALSVGYPTYLAINAFRSR